jgi:hypothetical protein
MGGSGTLPVMGGRIAATGDAKVYFVDPANGSDGNNGFSPDKALNTVSAAYAKTVDKSGDTIYLLNDGNTTGSSVESATITWSNDNVHLVGLCAPVLLSQRARIVWQGAPVVTPLINVTGNGNLFSNISIIEETTQDGVASVGVRVSGARNYFHNVAIMSMVNTNTGDEADSSCLLLSGGSENTFRECYIGVDTSARSAANASVECESAATRNAFFDCVFAMFADAGTPVFLEASSSSDIDRWVLFKDCLFINPDTMSACSTLTQAFNVVNGSNLGGVILVFNCFFNGCTNIFDGDSTSIRIMGPTSEAAAGVQRMMVATATDKP